jgi:hypothetical protein
MQYPYMCCTIYINLYMKHTYSFSEPDCCL